MGTRPKAIARIVMASLLAVLMATAGCGYFQKPTPNRGAYYPGTLTSALPNYPYPAMNFTATSQTDTQTLGGVSFVTIEETAATCTTLTFQVKVSNDGGTNYYALAVAPYVAGTLVPSTSAVTVSNNTPTLYVANVAGFTNIEIVTSSTFTCTGVNFYITGSSNPGLILNIG